MLELPGFCLPGWVREPRRPCLLSPRVGRETRTPRYVAACQALRSLDTQRALDSCEAPHTLSRFRWTRVTPPSTMGLGRGAPIPNDRPVVSFIVPALNEAPNLPPLFERLLAVQKSLGLASEILVVDDASDDDTFEVAQEAAQTHPEIRPLRKPLPHGLGRGVRAGLDGARGRVGVVVMADGVDPLESAVPEFCAQILERGSHLVLLSRYTHSGDAGSIPASYKILHSLFRFLTSTLLGVPHPDVTYAFRAFDIDFVRRLQLRSTGFEISPEITFRTFFAGGRIAEVAGRQTRRIRGQSNFRFSKVATGYGRVLGEALLMRLGLLRRRASANPVLP